MEAHLLTAVLKVPHETLLHSVKLGQLRRHTLAHSLHVLGALRQVLATFNSRSSDLERALIESTTRQYRSTTREGSGLTSSSALESRRESTMLCTLLFSCALSSSCCLRSPTSL